MTGFEDRWLRLVAAARQREDAGAAGLGLDAERAARLATAALAGAGRRRQVAAEWRGLLAAAGLFCVCLLGAGAAAEACGFGPALHRAARELAHVTDHVPRTDFIPPPPSAADLGLPALGARSPAELVAALGDWLLPSRPDAETSR